MEKHGNQKDNSYYVMDGIFSLQNKEQSVYTINCYWPYHAYMDQLLFLNLNRESKGLAFLLNFWQRFHGWHAIEMWYRIMM